MTSLRPLATCALLAAVGGFLYMKINESEPKLPAGAEEWSMSELDLGGNAASEVTPGTSGSTPPTNSVAGAGPKGEEAPPFVAGPAAPPASSAAVPPPTASADSAPTWTPGEAPAASPPPASTNEKNESSAIAHSAADTTPGVPPMPALPGGSAATPGNIAGPGDISVPEVDEVTAAPPASPPPTATGSAMANTATSAVEPPLSKPTLFSDARVAAQGALERGQLAEALATLSEWYGDPSLTPSEVTELNDMLSQLAGSVIYDSQSHRLSAPHIVLLGETLPGIAEKYNVPWQLLAKINGIADPATLTPGQPLKVLPGPFSAEVDLSERKLTLLLDRMYAGQFALEIEPTATVEEGEWKVDQKLETPAMGGLYGAPASATEDRSLLLANTANPASPPAIVRGPGNPDPVSAAPRDRVLRLKAAEVGDVYDILSEGSRVTIRR